ncbi:MAG: hypothetical protein WC880_01250 [Candidatus Paceibacterota bacterium]
MDTDTPVVPDVPMEPAHEVPAPAMPEVAPEAPTPATEGTVA